MNSASSWTVARRLVIAFSATIAIFLIVGAVSLYSSAKVADADEWNDHTYKVLGTADTMLRSMINMETGARGFLISGEDKFLEPWTQGQQAFETSWSDAKHLTSDNPAQQKRLDDIKAKNGEFAGVVKAMLQLRRDVTAGKKTMPEFIAEFGLARDKAAMDGFRELHREFDKAERDLLVVRSAAASDMRAFNRNVVIVGSVLALLAAGGLGFWVTRSITRQLGGEPDYAAGVANEIARGNLVVEVQVRAGDTTSLLAAMKVMRDSLVQVVSKVRGSSDSIATGSAQIATGNSDLSQRTEEQASNLQQTAASMEQISGTVKTSAETAEQASRLAGSASAAATKGGEMMGQVVNTMQDISASSRRIADIIGVIDGIAFQTNILALNAAVEAARAGEQGRGFAVVASEVRSLAGRSADAAKEIKTLIGASVERVEAGTKQVNDAGTSMGEIVSQVKRVSQMIEELSSAAREQASGVGQIGDAVQQLDQVTQQNAALVEESAAAAESLKHQAATLAEVVSVFKVGGAQSMVTGSYTPSSAASTTMADRRSPGRATHVARPVAKVATKSTPDAANAAGFAAQPSTEEWATF